MMQLIRIALHALEAIPESPCNGLFDSIRFIGHNDFGPIRPQASQDFILVAVTRPVNPPALPLCSVKQLTLGGAVRRTRSLTHTVARTGDGADRVESTGSRAAGTVVCKLQSVNSIQRQCSPPAFQTPEPQKC